MNNRFVVAMIIYVITVGVACFELGRLDAFIEQAIKELDSKDKCKAAIDAPLRGEGE